MTLQRLKLDSAALAYSCGDRLQEGELDVVSYLDGDSEQVIATVLYRGVTVLTVRTGILPNKIGDEYTDWLWDPPTWEEDRDDKNHMLNIAARFLWVIGEANDQYLTWAKEHPGEDPYSDNEACDYVGDGHEWVGFIGLVADAIHERWSQITVVPTGW